MDTKNIINNSDPIRQDDLRGLARQPGPAVSFVIPTHRGGPETLTDAHRLRPLLGTAREQLAERYPQTDSDALLAPVETLVNSDRFWQSQCDGLAIYVQPGYARYFRVDREYLPKVSVGDHPNLRPLLPLFTNDLEFLLLAMSRNKVRLFAADRATITELPLGEIPASADDVEGVSTREPQIQHHGSEISGVHGQGPRDYNVLNGFIQAVGKAIEKRFTGDGRPLVLATVDEYRGAIGGYLHNVALLDDVVSGNPDRLSDVQLHAAAWPIVEKENKKRHDDLVDQVEQALGTGLATHDPALISQESVAGRVATLVLAERALGEVARAEDLDAAIANTLINRGTIDVVSELPGGYAVGAVFRY
ncbi:baeRF3 domain-containing protein [Corynebacterium sp. S7]